MGLKNYIFLIGVTSAQYILQYTLIKNVKNMKKIMFVGCEKPTPIVEVVMETQEPIETFVINNYRLLDVMPTDSLIYTKPNYPNKKNWKKKLKKNKR